MGTEDKRPKTVTKEAHCCGHAENDKLEKLGAGYQNKNQDPCVMDYDTTNRIDAFRCNMSGSLNPDPCCDANDPLCIINVKEEFRTM